MLRKGIGTKRTNLRRLFGALGNGRNERPSPLTSRIRKDLGKSEAAKAADMTGSNGPKSRISIRSPSFRAEPVKFRVRLPPKASAPSSVPPLPKHPPQETKQLREHPPPSTNETPKTRAMSHNLQNPSSPTTIKQDSVRKLMFRYPPTRLYTHKPMPPPTSTRLDPVARAKLRKSLRPKQVDLRHLFEMLKNVRNARSGTLIELPSPSAGKENSKPKNWESIEEMEAADVTDDNEPTIRLFQQTIEPPSLLTKPLHLIPVSNTPDLDAEIDVSATRALSSIELYHLRKLIGSLEFFSHSPLSVSKEVFHWLSQFRSNPQVLCFLTPRAWELLWALEVDTIPSFRSRLIGDMMIATGVPLTEEQEIAYIGGLFWNGAKNEAITRWKEGNRSPNASRKYWNLGIRMLSLECQPENAEFWIGKMKDRFGSIDQKAWMPIILSWNHIYKPKRAWNAYEHMRQWARITNSPIKPAQYDDVCMSFLDGGGAAYGLRIYKHMVTEEPSSSRLQTQIYSQLNTFVKSAQETSESPKTLVDISLDALKSLPPKIQDKHFYGSWIKNLIRMGRTDLASYLACDVMVKAGFAPDSIHLDWIIQGFLEDGNERIAEALAEEMIQERLRCVKAKTQPDFDSEFTDWSAASSDTVPTTKHHPPKDSTLPAGPLATAPATVQTFSLLIKYQTRRQHMDKVVALSTLMAKAQIPANSYIFNHFLYSLLRTHDLPRLAQTFQILLQSRTAQPDLETWHVVWLAMWRRFTQTHRKFSEFPTPRRLFRDMAQYLPRRMVGLTLQDRSHVKKVWAMVIKCFMLAGDLPGGLVALHAGKRLWGIAANGDVATEISRGVFKNRDWDPRATGGVRPPVSGEMVGCGVSQVRELGRRLTRRRKARRLRVWKRVKDPEGLLEALTTLLRMEMGEWSGAGEAVARAITDMGVEGLKID